jgi:hypothetical protein
MINQLFFTQFCPNIFHNSKKGTPQYMTSLRHPDSSSGKSNYGEFYELHEFLSERRVKSNSCNS